MNNYFQSLILNLVSVVSCLSKSFNTVFAKCIYFMASHLNHLKDIYFTIKMLIRSSSAIGKCETTEEYCLGNREILKT